MVNHQFINGLRLLPINLIASLQLRKAGIAENLDVLPVFQLMEWGIASDKRRRYQDISGELAILVSIKQAVALDYLLKNVPGGTRTLLGTLMRLKPRAAAVMMLSVLDMRLKSDPNSLFGKHPKIPDPCTGCAGSP
jgi:hypothetical protein